MSREELYRAYVTENHNLRYIAKQAGVSYRTVQDWLTRYGIKLTAAELSGKRSHRGEESWNYQGGKITQNGYVYLRRPDDPSANRDGYVMEHRMIVEQAIGRRLYQGEQVHHIDFDKAHNWIENLILFPSAAAHTEFHKWMERVGAYTLGLIAPSPSPVVYQHPVLVAGKWANEISIELLGAIQRVA